MRSRKLWGPLGMTENRFCFSISNLEMIDVRIELQFGSKIELNNSTNRTELKNRLMNNNIICTLYIIKKYR